MPSLSRTVDHEQLTTDKKQLTCKKLWLNVKCQVSSVRKTRGFTLIELLVVIALIGILASFAVYSLNSAQQKGRDSRRKSDLDAIKKALYLFYTDNNQYPPLNWAGWCSRISSSTYPQVKDALEGGNYIRTAPTDPKLANQAGDYLYYRSGPNTFELYSILENTNDPANTGPFDKTGCADGYSPYHYLVTQP